MSDLHGSYTVLFQIKSCLTRYEYRELNSRADGLRHVHAHMFPGVKHLERGLVFKREQLWRAISCLFPAIKKKTEKTNKAKGGVTEPRPKSARLVLGCGFCPVVTVCPFHSQM